MLLVADLAVAVAPLNGMTLRALDHLVFHPPAPVAPLDVRHRHQLLVLTRVVALEYDCVHRICHFALLHHFVLVQLLCVQLDLLAEPTRAQTLNVLLHLGFICAF